MSSKDIDNEKMLQIKDFMESNDITNYCFLLESDDDFLSVFSENDPIKLYGLLHATAAKIMSICMNTEYLSHNNTKDDEIELSFTDLKKHLDS